MDRIQDSVDVIGSFNPEDDLLAVGQQNGQAYLYKVGLLSRIWRCIVRGVTGSNTFEDCRLRVVCDTADAILKQYENSNYYWVAILGTGDLRERVHSLKNRASHLEDQIYFRGQNATLLKDKGNLLNKTYSAAVSGAKSFSNACTKENARNLVVKASNVVNGKDVTTALRLVADGIRPSQPKSWGERVNRVVFGLKIFILKKITHQLPDDVGESNRIQQIWN